MGSKKYAVVYFLEENLYSEIPVSWISKDGSSCMWPNSLNARTCMIRGDVPQANWKKYKVRIEGYCSTLNSARQKAEDPEYLSTSGSDTKKGRGFRRMKKKVFDTSDEDSSERDTPPPRAPRLSLTSDEIDDQIDENLFEVDSQGFLQTTKTQEEHADNKSDGSVGSGGHEENDVTLIVATKKGNGGIHGHLPKHVDNKPDGSVDSGGREENDSTLVATKKGNGSNHDHLLNEIYLKVNKIEKTIDHLNKAVSSLRVDNGKMMMSDKYKRLVDVLPINKYEMVEMFERLVTDGAEMQETYVNFIKSIGGKDARDFVNRCLSTLFTNELGRTCSLVGHRGNFRLEPFTFMKVLQDTILSESRCSRYDVERAMSEWFRLSQQRIRRRERKEKP